jgi:hypothetical protein
MNISSLLMESDLSYLSILLEHTPPPICTTLPPASSSDNPCHPSIHPFMQLSHPMALRPASRTLETKNNLRRPIHGEDTQRAERVRKTKSFPKGYRRREAIPSKMPCEQVAVAVPAAPKKLSFPVAAAVRQLHITRYHPPVRRARAPAPEALLTMTPDTFRPPLTPARPRPRGSVSPPRSSSCTASPRSSPSRPRSAPARTGPGSPPAAPP